MWRNEWFALSCSKNIPHFLCFFLSYNNSHISHLIKNNNKGELNNTFSNENLNQYINKRRVSSDSSFSQTRSLGSITSFEKVFSETKICTKMFAKFGFAAILALQLLSSARAQSVRYTVTVFQQYWNILKCWKFEKCVNGANFRGSLL